MAVREQQSTSTLPQSDDGAGSLLQLIDELAHDIRPQQRRVARTTLDSRLERDLGFDSLSRVELLTRIERSFGVSLSEQVFTTAETPRDLLRLVKSAATRQPATVAPAPAPTSLEEAAAAPDDAQTLVDVLQWHVQHNPDRPHVYLLGDEDQEQQISFGELLEGAQAVAAGLQRVGLEPGETAAIMLPTSREYLVTFFGALLAGGIPVPIYPPVRPAQIEDHLRRHVGILSSARVPILITVPEARPLARLLKAHVECLRRVVGVRELEQAGGSLTRPPLRGDDVAFVQYTSGSTADPKGVVLTHYNLLSNIRAMGTALQVDS
ncbi:MAG: AMP-binding protein, partial [Acidiferrobacterales bacterium]